MGEYDFYHRRASGRARNGGREITFFRFAELDSRAKERRDCPHAVNIIVYRAFSSFEISDKSAKFFLGTFWCPSPVIIILHPSPVSVKNRSFVNVCLATVSDSNSIVICLFFIISLLRCRRRSTQATQWNSKIGAIKYWRPLQRRSFFSSPSFFHLCLFFSVFLSRCRRADIKHFPASYFPITTCARVDLNICIETISNLSLIDPIYLTPPPPSLKHCHEKGSKSVLQQEKK